MMNRVFSPVHVVRRCAAVAIVCLGLSQAAWAQTATVTIQYLPLQEAANLVQSQLSAKGHVAQLPSRRLLVIQDDSKHISQAKALLKKLDVPLTQFSVQVNMEAEQSDNGSGVRLARGTALSGGWVRLKPKAGAADAGSVQLQAGTATQLDMQTRHFNLYITSGKRGHIEAGEVQVARPEVQQTLEHYGVEDNANVELVPITAGFDVEATPIDASHVRLHIRPWFRRMQQKTDIQAKTEILLGLGSTNAPQRPPGTSAPMRANITPSVPVKKQYIWLADAETELVVELGKPVELAAASGAAHAFSQTLLSSGFNLSEQTVRFRIQVNKVR